MDDAFANCLCDRCAYKKNSGKVKKSRPDDSIFGERTRVETTVEMELAES